LSLSIFVALVNNFKEKLKMEVGIFLEQVLVRILASENSSFNHKLLVLQVFFRITSNPKLTVELFLNYDCDLDERDIFSRMIDMLAKIGQGKYSKTEALLPAQESALRLTALETLVNIMTTLVAWMDTDTSQRDSFVQSDDTSEDSSMLEATTIIEPDRFEQQKMLKSLLSKAVAKFNIKPSLAIRYLASCHQLDPTNPKEIALFLRNTAGLNKTKIGEYLGKADADSKAVLHEFVFMQEYRDLDLLPALRMFLNTFRLPGEGQQVDRLMEKFAEKYCIDNPNVFETADTAFVLLYSIIMLQTDANNPGVKKKMTFEDYLKITRGINNGKDLPREFLEDIFTSIKTSPITLKDDEELLLRLEGTGKRKDEMFEKESQFILAVSKESMGKARRSEFVENATIDYIKPLFESVWHALLAAFSVVLEESQEQQTYNLALTGVLSCIRIAAKFAMHLELESFVSCLSKFTSLLLLKEEMTQKNVECVKILIYAAKLEANALRSSWGHVLRCVSKLDYLHLVSEGSRGDMFMGSQGRRPEITGAEEVFSSIKMQDIDYLFSISSSLDNEAIVEFVEQLVLVSHEEIWNEQPRIFSLQALVTVADVNMNRIRLVWGKIWACLKSHFSQAGLHHNQYIAMFAIDSLKQLAIKFLQKEELSNFRFQKEFLQPFTSILKETNSQAVKELVVDCMTNLVLTLAANIKSGWQCIVDVFLTATLDEVLLQKIFPALVKIAESEMDKVLEQFGEMLNCVMNCAISSRDEIALKALDLTINCAEVLAKGKVDVSSHWHVLLVRLGEKLSDVRPSVQQRATNVLFSILEKQTDEFGEEQWRMVWTEVMMPLFEDASFSTKLNTDWLKTFHQLQLAFVDIIASKYTQLAFLIPDYLTSLHNCIKAGVESTAKSAVSALKSLAMKLAPQLPSSTWQLLCSLIRDLFKSIAPSELLTCPIDTLLKERKEALPFSTEACVSKCVIQLQLLALVKDMLEGQFSLIPKELVLGLLGSVRESHAFAVSFNEQILRRYGLWRSGFMGDLKTLPGLNRQHSSALTLYLTFSFKLLEECEDIKSDLISMCKQVITSYTSKETRTPKEGDILIQLENASVEQELALLRPILSNHLVDGITRSKEMRALVSELKEELLSLVVSSSVEVREALKRLLLLVVA
jgi:brefeldin A-inhibited guanine nucleotide-exchange protein